MSEDEEGYTSVLLPGAQIALFTRDEETKQAFLALEQDWRYARVKIEAFDGDVSTAAALYEKTPSPDLVIVQTETIDGGLSEELEILAGNCAEGTSAIVIGPVNDVNLYKQLMGMGVSEYIVKPVTTRSLGNDIAVTLIEQLGASDSRLIALIGSKGGVGTTVLAESLAWGISDDLRQKTFLIDTAGGWSTLSVGMNFEPSTTLGEAVRAAVEHNNDSLTRMLFTPSERLTILSSGGDIMLEDVVDPAGFEALIDMLMVTYPVIIADLSASPAALRRLVLSRAHEILLVTTPTLPAVRATRTLLHEIKNIRGKSDEGVHVISNMVGISAKQEVPRAQIEEGLEVKLAAEIPFDPALFIGSENEARKLSDDKAGAPVVSKLLTVVQKLVAPKGVDNTAANDQSESKSSGGLGQLLTKLKSK